MAAVVLTFFVCWLVMAALPTIPLSRSLRSILVDRLAARLSRITRGDVAIGIVLIVAAGMVAFVGEGDGIRMTMMAVPDAAIWLTTFEISAYVDVVIAIAAAASSLRIRGLGSRLAAIIIRRPTARANRRVARIRKATPPAANNDDGHGRLFAIAA